MKGLRKGPNLGWKNCCRRLRRVRRRSLESKSLEITSVDELRYGLEFRVAENLRDEGKEKTTDDGVTWNVDRIGRGGAGEVVG